jgi:hypothetical protein
MAGMQTSDSRTMGWKGALGILIAAVVVFCLIVLLFGVSWYAWGLLGVIIVAFGIFSVARFGVRRADRAPDRPPS